jgi:hypothetical protein
MKKTLNIDDKLLREAADTVRSGPDVPVQPDACQRLRAFLGTEPDARDVPRRRERPSTKRGASRRL